MRHVRGLVILVGATALLGCSNVDPKFTELASLPGPTSLGKSSSEIVIHTPSASVTVSGECPKYYTGFKLSFDDGASWVAAETVGSDASDLDGADEKFAIVISDISAHLQFTASGETHAVLVRGLVRKSEIAAALKVTVKYIPSDLTPPAIPSGITLASPASSPSSSGTPAFTVTHPGDAEALTLKLFSDSACTVERGSVSLAAGSTSASVTSAALAEGAYSFYANATDGAGNASGCVGPASYVRDATPPVIPLLALKTPAGTPGNIALPVLTVSASDSSDLAVALYSDSACTTLKGGGTIASGQTSADITSGMLAQGSHSFYASATDAAGNVSACAGPVAYTFDNTSPLIDSITSAQGNGAFAASAEITIKVTFSEPVLVNGTPAIGLSTSSQATYASGSGTATLSFTYTVMPGDTSPDLDVTGFSMGGATVTDMAGNAADLTLPASQNLASNKDLVIDTTAPLLTGLVTHSAYLNSLSQSPSLSWPSAYETGSGLAGYEIAIGSTPGGTDIKGWTDAGTDTNATINALSLTEGSGYYPSVRARDGAGNLSLEITSTGWIPDVTPPEMGSVTLDDGSDSFDRHSSPQLNWTTAPDSISGVYAYKVALGTTPGGTDIQDWTLAGNDDGHQFTGLSLVRGAVYYASLRAYDNAGNVSTTVQGDGWVMNSELWHPNGLVNSVVKVGKILYLGGSFTALNEWIGGFVPISSSTGVLSWPSVSYRARVAGQVTAVVDDGFGGWYIGGNFNGVGGVPRRGLAHILSDGSVDTGFVFDVDNAVYSLALDGPTLYVGGSFAKVNSATRQNIAAINVNTASLLPFGPSVQGPVYAIAASFGRIYVGGTFTASCVQAFNPDGSNVSGFNVPQSGCTVFTIAPNPTNGTVYFGGLFSAVNSITRYYLAEVDKDSGSLTSFNPSGNAAVSALALDGTTLYVGGSFTTIGGQSRNHVAALDTSTGLATSFNPNVNGNVSSMQFSGGTLYVGGAFSTAGGSARLNFAAFGSGGTLTALNPNPTSTITALGVSGGLLYLGGAPMAVNGSSVSAQNLAAIDLSTGAPDASFAHSALGGINTMAVAGNKLYIGGAFTQVDGSARNRLAAIDISSPSGTLTSFDPNVNAIVHSLLVSGATVYAGGAFTLVNGSTSQPRLAAFDSSSGSWNSTFIPVVNNTVYSLAASGSTLYFGGLFTNVNSTTRNYLAAVDATTGALDAGFAPTLNASVKSVAVSHLGNLYVGGGFTTINSTARSRLAELTPAGALTSFDPQVTGGGPTVSVIMIKEELIYIGGFFTSVGGQSRANLAAVDTSGNLVTAFNPGALGTVTSLTGSGGYVYVGGSFTAVGMGTPYIGPVDVSTGEWVPLD